VAVEGGGADFLLVRNEAQDSGLDLAPQGGFPGVEDLDGRLGLAVDGEISDVGLDLIHGRPFLPDAAQDGHGLGPGQRHGLHVDGIEGLGRFLVVLGRALVGGIQDDVAQGLLGLQAVGPHFM